jgi:hypothetical protein
MHGQTKHIPSDRERRLQRAIVVQTLSENRGQGWPRARLEIEIGEADVLRVADALAYLEGEGVLDLDGETVRASDATLCLDELELIAI